MAQTEYTRLTFFLPSGEKVILNVRTWSVDPHTKVLTWDGDKSSGWSNLPFAAETIGPISIFGALRRKKPKKL